MKRKTQTIRVREGEHVLLRLEIDGKCLVVGDATDLAEELYANAYARLLASKRTQRRREFLAGTR